MDQIRVGAFELDPSERSLSQAGKPVELGARAFDLLLVLVENHGRLVTKATLLERVWPRLVVDENNLPAQIANLRRILGAGAIRTVPSFGYRLELDVQAAGSAEADTSEARVEATEPSEPQHLSVPRSAWPERQSALIGRERDVQGVEEALRHACLVTVAGGAGIGKTRLAQEILTLHGAEQHAVVWVPLESIALVQHVPSAIALALGLSLPDGMDGFLALQQVLEQVSVLLILDGAEHMSEALAKPLGELLSHTRALRVLITSQSPLGIGGEIVYRLTPLSVPDASASDAAIFPAVSLFVQRAIAADRRFELNAANAATVAAICRRLDGNPLALELAAARVHSLGVAALLEHLDDRFRLLKLTAGASDPRHGTLRTAFGWSHSLLSGAERSVFNRLGAFSGSFSLTAASRCVADASIDAVEAIDLIGRLVDRSLVTALPLDPPRYTLLETARCFAVEQLEEAGQLETALGKMALVTLQLLDTAYQEYWSLDEAIWLQRYGADLENVRAAIDWAVEYDRTLAIALYGSAWPLFVETGVFAEARARYEQTVRLLSDGLPRARLGRYWEAVATYDSTRQYDRARYAAELAAAMHGECGDARSRYYALMLLALNWRGDDPAARAAFDAAKELEDTTWPERLLTQGALTEGALLVSAGDYSAARTAYRRAMRLALTVSERQALAATVSIVELDLAGGDHVAALQLARPLSLSLRRSGRHGAHFELLTLMFAALLLSGETTQAREIGAELHGMARMDSGKLYSVLYAMAFLACEERRFEVAAQITHCADTAYREHGQLHRRPIEERLRQLVMALLGEKLSLDWQTDAATVPIDETRACALALRLTM